MKKIINSSNAPAAVGSYSQAVTVGSLLFISGQLCINPTTREMERESITSQTVRVMENIKAIVEEAGTTMDNIVKCTVFLSDMRYFSEFDAVYKSYFSTTSYPARSTVGNVKIYSDLDVEIDAIATI